MTETLKPSGDEIITPGGFLLPFGIELPAALLEQALTHRSWRAEHPKDKDNERLEFLGDSVLGLAVTTKLYKEFHLLGEGDLSKSRAALVSSDSLSKIARQIGLGQHIKLGRGELRSGGQNKDSILADTLEAVIGAVYIEHGPTAAEKFVNNLIKTQFEKLDELILFFDPKTVLQEEAVARGEAQPAYSITQTGPDHDRVFTARVKTAGITGVGSGSNKKAAEMQAAKEVITKLLERNDLKSGAK